MPAAAACAASSSAAVMAPTKLLSRIATVTCAYATEGNEKVVCQHDAVDRGHGLIELLREFIISSCCCALTHAHTRIMSYITISKAKQGGHLLAIIASDKNVFQ
jgi:hypothetical protein